MLNRITEIKLELLCRGVRVSEGILKRFPGYRYKRASLSEGLCFHLFPEGCKTPVPANLAIREKFVQKSPFFFDEKKGMIIKDGDDFVKASIIDFPLWYSEQLKDGTYLQEIFQVHYHKILATSLTNFCEYKENGSGCRFCAMGYQIKEQKIKSAEHIKEALEKLMAMGEPFSEINLNSGTLLNEKSNVEHYLNILNAVRSVTDLPIYCQICPPSDFSFIDRIIEAGISSLSFNLEVYDDKIRKSLMPSKGLIPRDLYFKALAYAAEKLGAAQVSSWLIAGLEPPESTILGIEHIASAGAVPFVTVFRPLIGSEFEDSSPPDPEDVRPIFEALGKTLRKINYESKKTSAGCVKCNCCSAISEVML